MVTKRIRLNIGAISPLPRDGQKSLQARADRARARSRVDGWKARSKEHRVECDEPKAH